MFASKLVFEVDTESKLQTFNERWKESLETRETIPNIKKVFLLRQKEN